MAQFIRHMSDDEIALVFSVFKRVGRTRFKHQDIADLMPNYMRLRSFKDNKVIKKFKKSSGSTAEWQFRDEMAAKLEHAMKMRHGEKFYADIVV
jgi:hypothetical protein